METTTNETLTDEQILTLRDEAKAAGNLAQVCVCNQALDMRDACTLPRKWARAAIVKTINAARAMEDK
jgi:hypothetical protein